MYGRGRGFVFEGVGEVEGKTLRAEPEASAVSRAVVALCEVEDRVSEGVLQEGNVLCLVRGADGHSGRWAKMHAVAMRPSTAGV